MKWRSLEEPAQASDVRPLREILAERKEMISKYVPAETQAVHARAIAELKQTKPVCEYFACRRKDSGIPTSRSQ